MTTTTPSEVGVTSNSDKNNPRELFGWKMYDWANSAFYTTVVGALFSPYLTRLAQTAVGENGVVLDLGPLGAVTAKSLPTLCVSISVGAQVFLLPILGALGDYSDLKKRLMALFCYIAVTANCLLFFIQGNLYLLGGLLFIIANVGFGASIVFYNAFLPEITTEDQSDKVSSRGFAYGYLGGAILLVLNLLLVLRAEQLGISAGLAVRLSLLSAGIWWGGFAIISFYLLKSRPKKKSLPPGQSYLTAGFKEIIETFKELRRLPLTARYLLGYLIYNDGIQTVIFASSAFLEQELFPGGNPVFLLEIFLMVQFVAVAGALIFERLAYLIKTKNDLGGDRDVCVSVSE
jgi:UMF1 family MFS transporter